MPSIANHAMQHQLSGAILLYKNHGKGCFASIHDVDVEQSSARILAGRPITIEAIEKTMSALAKAAGTETIQWTDEAVVATSPTLTCWWTPACERWMHFDAPNLKASKPSMQPPLVWIACGDGLMVFALKDNEKPTQDTVLLQSPYFNVYSDGKVCRGSMAVPKAPRRKDWEEAFFASVFTHTNPPGRKVTKHKRGDAALWKKQMSDKMPQFPVSQLHVLNQTLGQLIRRLAKE